MNTAIRTFVLATTAAATLLAATVAPAAAGSSERAFIKGVAAALIVSEIVRQSRRQPVQRSVPAWSGYDTVPATRTYAPAPVVRYVPDVRYVQQPAPRVVYRDPAIYATPLAWGFADLAPDLRRTVQNRLLRMGYYNGRVDGLWGPQTNLAVRAYARDSGALAALDDSEDAFRLYNTLLY